MSITLIIVIISSIVSIACFNNPGLLNKLKHHPYVEGRNHEYYRWLTSGFVHGDIVHLMVNMFVLYQFGQAIEYYFKSFLGNTGGGIVYTLTYLLIIVMADIRTYYKHINNPYFASVGASGGVSGILFIYILLYPWSMLGLYAIIPVPAIIFGALYLWYSTWAANNQRDNVDHDAHFYGAVAGILIAIVTRPAIIMEFLHHLINDFPWK